jgi:hypothetical protein
MRAMIRLPLAALLAALFVAPAAGQALPTLTDEMLKQAGAVLHVDVKTGRMAGITDRGPIAEVGAKVVEVMFGDHAADEWIAYTQRVEGEYVKPAVSQRLLLLKREGDRVPLVDADFTPQARESLGKRLAEYRRDAELLTGAMHVPDYLLRSPTNGLLHVEVRKTTPYDRGKGNLSATHVAKVIGVAQGDFKPGDTIEYTEEGRSPQALRADRQPAAHRAREPGTLGPGWPDEALAAPARGLRLHRGGIQGAAGRRGARARGSGGEEVRIGPRAIAANAAPGVTTSASPAARRSRRARDFRRRGTSPSD